MANSKNARPSHGWHFRNAKFTNKSSLIWTDQTSGMTVYCDYVIPGKFCITFPELAEFFVCFHTKSIQQRVLYALGSSETIDHLLQDQLLPRLIAHEGDLVLHGGGIAIDDQAIAIMAPTGHGKSTLTASLRSTSHCLLGDDALIVGADLGRPTVRAVYSSLRLLPDSVAHLFEEAIETRTMAHYSKKRHITVDGSSKAVPLSLLIFLTPPTPDISARRMTVAETCMSLIANSFALDPTDTSWTAANMRRASALAATVPAYALSYPRDYAALPSVHTKILDTLSTINDAP